MALRVLQAVIYKRAENIETQSGVELHGGVIGCIKPCAVATQRLGLNEGIVNKCATESLPPQFIRDPEHLDQKPAIGC